MQKFFERSSVCALIIVIITQTITFLRIGKSGLADDFFVNGTQLEAENYTFKTGEAGILLLEPSIGTEVVVFVNGVEVSNFNENTLKISVKENDYIEIINFSMFSNNLKGKIIYISDHFDEKYLQMNFESENGRVAIGRICIKKSD